MGPINILMCVVSPYWTEKYPKIPAARSNSSKRRLKMSDLGAHKREVVKLRASGPFSSGIS